MLNVLEKAARECGKILLEVRGQGLSTEDKADQLGAHFSTEGDQLSQERGIEIIKAAVPHEVVIGEEQKHDPTIPPDCTVLDPCDGTTSYYSGGHNFGVNDLHAA